MIQEISLNTSLKQVLWILSVLGASPWKGRISRYGVINPGPAEPAFANSVGQEANWSGSALFVIIYLNLYQQPGSSNLIGWQLEVGVASYFIQHDKG